MPAFLRAPRAQSIVGEGADLTVAFIASCESVSAAFDLETATGEQLDRLGEILQYPRQGETDDRYRRLVQMQAQTILSSAGSTAVLLEIVQIWTESTAGHYSEPDGGLGLEVDIGAELVDISDDRDLIAFLSRAKLGGVRLTLGTYPPGAVWDYTEADPVTDAGLADYTPADLTVGAALVGLESVV